MNRRPDRAVQLMEEMQRSGVQPITFSGWDRAAEGIARINKLEQQFDIIKKDSSGIAAYGELMKVCVECGRRDLVVKVTQMMQQANVKWEEVHEQLQKDDPKLLEQIQLWLQQAGEVPLSEEQLKRLDATSVV